MIKFEVTLKEQEKSLQEPKKIFGKMFRTRHTYSCSHTFHTNSKASKRNKKCLHTHFSAQHGNLKLGIPNTDINVNEI